MASTGDKFASTIATVVRGGSTTWTSPTNAGANDASDATAAVPTDYLVCTNFSFNIPPNAVIVGVTVKVDASETGSGTSDYIPQLITAATPTLVGSAKTAVVVSGATKVTSTNGSTSDVWSATLTPSIVNTSGFGVAIWSTDTTNTLAINFVTMAIEYTMLAPAREADPTPARPKYYENGFVVAPVAFMLAALAMPTAEQYFPDVHIRKPYQQVEQARNQLVVLPRSPGVPRTPLYTHINPRRYQQIDQVGSRVLGPIGIPIPFVTLEQPNGAKQRYYAQLDPVPNLLTKEVVTAAAPFVGTEEPAPIARRQYHQQSQWQTELGVSADLGTTVIREPVYTRIYRRYYHQIEQRGVGTAILPVAPAVVLPFSLKDWPTPRRFRYSPAPDPIQTTLGVAPDLGTMVIRPPLFNRILPRRALQVEYAVRKILASVPVVPPVDVTGTVVRDHIRIEHSRRKYNQLDQIPRNRVLNLPPPPFRQSHWVTPQRLRLYDYLTFIPFNLFFQVDNEYLVSWAEFEKPDPRRYFHQPDSIRNPLVIDQVKTALYTIQNIDYPISKRPYYAQIEQLVNLVSRDRVVTPPPTQKLLDQPNPPRYRYYEQYGSPPNILVQARVATQLFPIGQNQYPITYQRKIIRIDDPPNLLTSTLQPQPLSWSQRDWTPENHQRRSFAQPDPVPNSLILDIPAAPTLRLAWDREEWAIPYRLPYDVNTEGEYQRTDINSADLPNPRPTLTFRATPPRIREGRDFTLSWTSQYATTLTASGGWSGSKVLNGSQVISNLLTSTLYRLDAAGPGGTTFAQVYVVVIAVPPPPVTDSGLVEVRPAGRIVIEPKLVGQTAFVTFDFISSLPRGEAIVSASVRCQVNSGFDSSSSAVISGSSTISGTVVTQKIKAGVAGVVYDLLCRIVTESGNTLTMSAYLAVVSQRSADMAAGRQVGMPKKLGETITIPFEFASDLGAGETITSAQVTATVYSGVHASPQSIITGSESVSGTKVFQKVRAGVVGVQYTLKCEIHTSAGQVLDRTQYCTVIPDYT